MIIVIIILAIALISVIIYSILLKKDLRSISNDFNFIIESDTNKKLTSLSFDKDICALENLINTLLDKQKQILIESERLNVELKNAMTNISHDLRTPLTSVLGYIQILKNDNIDHEKRSEYLDRVQNKLLSLTGLIDALFEFSILMENKTKMELNKVNICNTLRDSLSLFYDDFVNSRFEVETDICDEPIYVICDSNALMRVFQNLLKNILIHGQKNVYIMVDRENNSIMFKNDIVDDSFDASRLFDRFYTADQSRSIKGTGLGLAIAKELIQGMGGEISAQKENNKLIVTITFK